MDNSLLQENLRMVRDGDGDSITSELPDLQVDTCAKPVDDSQQPIQISVPETAGSDVEVRYLSARFWPLLLDVPVPQARLSISMPVARQNRRLL